MTKYKALSPYYDRRHYDYALSTTMGLLVPAPAAAFVAK